MSSSLIFTEFCERSRWLQNSKRIPWFLRSKFFKHSWTNKYFIRILWKNRHRKIVLQKHFIPLWLSWEKKLKWGHCHSHMATLNYALYLKSSTVRTSSTVQSSLLNCKLSFMQWVVWSSVDNLMNINDISHLKHK